jgi:hypothetical protein
METMEPGSPDRVFVEFGQKRVTQDAVMRSVVSHPDWLVSAHVLAEHYRPWSLRGDTATLGTDCIIFSGEWQLPGTELWLFTGYEAADRAKEQGARLGILAGGIHGTELFGNLDPAWDWVKINPGSPFPLTLNIPRAGFDDARLWAGAVAFEDTLKAIGPFDRDALRQQILRYENFLVLVNASTLRVGPSGSWTGSLLLFKHQGAAMLPAFTARDCMDAFSEHLPPGERAGLSGRAAFGLSVLEERGGEDGLYINPFGPGYSVVLPR